jgi:hypothetical protein
VNGSKVVLAVLASVLLLFMSGLLFTGDAEELEAARIGANDDAATPARDLQLPTAEPNSPAVRMEPAPQEVPEPVQSDPPTTVAARPVTRVPARSAARSKTDGIFLEVIDATDASELRNLVIVNASQRSTGYWGTKHPGSDYEKAVIARGLTSPIDLRAVLEDAQKLHVAKIFIGQADYTWVLFDFGKSMVGGHRVVLEPAGSLELFVTGTLPPEDALLSLAHDASARWGFLREPLGTRDRVLLEGLAPGTYEASIRLGLGAVKPTALAKVQFDVSKWTRTQTTLLLVSTPEAEYASASGELFLSEQWEVTVPTVTLKLISDAQSDSGTSSAVKATRNPQADKAGSLAFSFSFERVQVGRHELGLSEPIFFTKVEIPPTGRSDLRLEIPHPSSLTVELIDSITRQRISSESIYWGPSLNNPESAHVLRVATLDPKTSLHLIRTPYTRVALYVFDGSYGTAFKTIDIAGGITHYTMELVPTMGISITMLDGEVPVPFLDATSLNPRAASGTSGEVTIGGVNRYKKDFKVTSAGTYVFDIATPPGYESIGTIEVEVTKGRTSEHRIQLERL